MVARTFHSKRGNPICCAGVINTLRAPKHCRKEDRMPHQQELEANSTWRLEPLPHSLARLAKATMRNTPYRRPSRNVLLAIGDAEFREETRVRMNGEGFCVESFEDGDHLLQRVGDVILQLEDCAPPDLIIADSNLIGCKGENLRRTIRELDWETSLVLLSHGKAIAYQSSQAPQSLGPVSAQSLCGVSERLLDSRACPDAHETQVAQRRWFSLSDALRTISLYSSQSLKVPQQRPR